MIFRFLYFRWKWYSGSCISDENDIQVLVFKKRRIFRFSYFRIEDIQVLVFQKRRIFRFLYFRREGYSGSCISEEKNIQVLIFQKRRIFRFVYFRREGYSGSCISEEKDIQVLIFPKRRIFRFLYFRREGYTSLTKGSLHLLVPVNMKKKLNELRTVVPEVLFFYGQPFTLETLESNPTYWLYWNL